MHFIETIYLLASTASVLAMAPQVRRLLITKQSDELSLFTWSIWTAYQFISLIYSVTIHAVPFLIANIVWLTFYVVMVALIIKYRSKIREPVSQEAEDHSA